MSILLALVVIPPLFLMHRIYRMDKVEKEPVVLIVKLFICGMISTMPAMLWEELLTPILSAVADETSLFYIAAENFLIVAMAEECCKYWFLKTGTWKNREFDYRFDGIVYAAAVGLGFAFLENILYVFMDESDALGTAVMRAVTSVPGHCTFGIMMGYYYGEAKYALLHGREAEARRLKKLAVLIPVLLHGFYDFILSTEWIILELVFLIYIVWLDRKAIRRVKDSSAEDAPVNVGTEERGL